MIDTDDEPLTLADACKEVFKNKISPASLRAEAKRGRLIIERIGRTDFVTRSALREMRRKCQLDLSQKDQDSGFSQSARDRDGRQNRPSGSSETMAASNVALDSLLLSVEALSKPSPATSPNGTRRRGAKVIRLKQPH